MEYMLTQTNPNLFQKILCSVFFKFCKELEWDADHDLVLLSFWVGHMVDAAIEVCHFDVDTLSFRSSETRCESFLDYAIVDFQKNHDCYLIGIYAQKESCMEIPPIL